MVGQRKVVGWRNNDGTKGLWWDKGTMVGQENLLGQRVHHATEDVTSLVVWHDPQ